MDSRSRFSWSDDDVVLKDADGNEVTPRQALEQQVTQRREALEQAGSVDPDEDED